MIPIFRQTCAGILLFIVVCSGCAAGRGSGADSNLRAVIFSYPEKAESFCVTGDFNQWSAVSHCTNGAENGARIEITLSPGHYQYGFVLNGEGPIPDPNNPYQVIDDFGGINSVILVR